MIGFKSKFKTYFITGLLVSAPIAITVWLIRSLVSWSDSLFGIQRWLPIPGLGLILAFVVILFCGMVTTNVLGKMFFDRLTKLVNKIPLVGLIYSGTKQILTSFLDSSSKKFGRVVLIEFPRAGCWSIGFVTTTAQITKMGDGQEPLVGVFVPTTPNPTSGFLVYVPESQLRSIDISVEQAFRRIVSLGTMDG